jgi:DNA mismatch repair protein MutS
MKIFSKRKELKTVETPSARQLFSKFKQKYPGCIMFFRMGDFYETFFEDAETCSKILGIELTSRDIGSDKPIPLASVPWHAVNGYLKKMLQAGYKVAVCEQIEDPKTAKGNVCGQIKPPLRSL